MESHQSSQSQEPEESFELALFRVAEAQIASGHHFLAVVIAQAAVEAVVEVTFMALFVVNLPRSTRTLLEVLPDRSFQKRGTRRLWTELTDDDLTSHRDIWRPYQKHIERRNRAAHGSGFVGFFEDAISRGEAEASIEAARNMTTHIHQVMKQTWDALSSPEGRAVEFDDGWRALRVLSLYGEEQTATRVGQAVRAARERAGLSHHELARTAHIHPMSVVRLEDGARPPQLATLIRVAAALRLPVAELVAAADLDELAPGDPSDG